MNARLDSTTAPTTERDQQTTSRNPVSADSPLYREGFIAGLVGAAAIALWFLIIDTIHGRPLYTPSLLGTAIFRHGAAGLQSPETFPVSMEMAWMFTWVHALVFVAIGGVAAHFMALAEKSEHWGFGILLLLVFLESFFVVAMTILAAPLLRALTWQSVLVANLLAAAAMAGYFRFAHPRLRVDP